LFGVHRLTGKYVLDLARTLTVRIRLFWTVERLS
jgi:hypothetical protein